MRGRMLERDDSALLVIDVQEGYRDKTFEHERMVRGVRTLIEAARLLAIPIVATEQYPKGVGKTQSEVAECFADAQPLFEKMSMSCLRQPHFAAHLRGLGRRQIVVCGIEAHACINQTTHDLLDAGYQVHLAHDAITSRFERDYRIAWEKMVGSGAVPATVEMVCLEWVRTAEAPEFKAIRKLIK